MIDLHCHTHISDNSYSIEEVIGLAKEQGVQHLAITDHDTTIGLPSAILHGAKYGVNIIPGIEISAYDHKRGVRAHILGLFVTPGHSALSQLCDPLIQRRHEASYEMVEQIIAAGYNISWQQVGQYSARGTGVYKQHIMHALLDAGYTSTIYGELYKKLFARGDQAKGIARGLAYQTITYINMFDAIKAIAEAGGIPVLAHPGQMGNFPAIPELVDAGLQGIEVWHPSHNQAAEQQAKDAADAFNLLQTGGSDFHGFYTDSPGFPLGSKSPGKANLEALMSRVGKHL
ncbi:PHP domain-containing protein [Paenibacillus sp. SYP-B3998]|uniref:PHP domain-containing protein n=1 Tax=Paenibacillus sp. SYP-B3998 TaxID=2678564 RepID=A0A6G4A1A3_9BACL|nr:PHP domain-containing protein [Paenibacillus sp. SYP-B3998]NEW08120.1 PHP domain-containing protein [Paenibacillus sp. SYP-B3998]